ncbi:PREDICTED: cysteine-rich venom protein TEL1-like [Nanorana parkeri]|uniref:cysteine-rich venom protein TEL1-like n=1 Tax=Nanorana parkeri TaxID=125878 RepID=UPI000854835B|nr:PREDICTED: cysteine-rich venom protein TEL1-like [Nanorana parkeri]
MSKVVGECEERTAGEVDCQERVPAAGRVAQVQKVEAELETSRASDSSDSSNSGEKENKLGTRRKANQKEIVRCHNDIRRQVNPSASDMIQVKWNNDAARNAEAVAKMCSNKHSDPSKRVIQKPSVTTCGENLYFSSGPNSWKEVINDWKSEVEGFKYGYGPKTSSDIIGHYTQIVWASSKLIGCSYRYCEKLAYPHLYVCHYCPAGNNRDTMKTPYKKGKACSKCKGKCENKLCGKNCGSFAETNVSATIAGRGLLFLFGKMS